MAKQKTTLANLSSGGGVRAILDSFLHQRLSCARRRTRTAATTA